MFSGELKTRSTKL